MESGFRKIQRSSSLPLIEMVGACTQMGRDQLNSSSAAIKVMSHNDNNL